MAITRIGAGAGDGTTITIPANHQRGDLVLIYSFRSATTAPTLPAGWTSALTASAGASSFRLGWKLAISNADTSGTWTNATGLVVAVYRGVATNKTPLGTPIGTTATSATVTYSALSPLKEANTSWVVAFGATKTTTSTLETAPANLTNCATAVGAANEYAGHDSNAAYTIGAGVWPSTDVAVTVSAEWRSATVEIFAEQGLPMNFQFGGTSGLSVAR